MEHRLLVGANIGAGAKIEDVVMAGDNRSLQDVELMTPEKSFEASLEDLERIVQQLETGDLPLDRSLELFEQGVRLSRDCQKRLDEAERKIEILLKGTDGAYVPTPFEETEE